MSPEDLARLLAKPISSNVHSDLDGLNERELEVFSLLGQGYSPSQLQDEFGIAADQLKALKQQLLAKLALRNEQALLRHARKVQQPDPL